MVHFHRFRRMHRIRTRPIGGRDTVGGSPCAIWCGGSGFVGCRCGRDRIGCRHLMEDCNSMDNGYR